MKETVNVNVGSQAFTLDDDACRVLRNYLDEIRSRLPEGDTETMEDIEVRIAEIFRESVSSPMRVISLETVRRTMSRMGTPSDFGDRKERQTAGKDAEQAAPPFEKSAAAPPRCLYRSRVNHSIAGVCGGIAEYFGCDVTVVRLITLFLFLFGGLSLWVYFILWIVLPQEPERIAQHAK